MSSKSIDFLNELLSHVLGKLPKGKIYAQFAGMAKKETIAFAILQFFEDHGYVPDEADKMLAYAKEFIRYIGVAKFVADRDIVTILGLLTAEGYRKRSQATEEADDREIIANALAEQEKEEDTG